MFRAFLIATLLACSTGCHLFPRVGHEPQFFNPFPQLSKVAIAPFFNLSTEPTVDGRQFALAYFNELQLVPGFEVVPVGVVERAMQQYNIQLNHPGEARRLAQVLGVDAIVIGAITDFSPYYPPRCGLKVEWYAANPGFHPIPPGYGLPWGTCHEEEIPESLIFEAEMALAREQLKTQTPVNTLAGQKGPAAPAAGPALEAPPLPSNHPLPLPGQEGQAMSYTADAAGDSAGAAAMAAGTAAAIGTDLPPDWPDPRGFVPPPPSPVRPEMRPTMEPVLSHARTYNGHDTDFTTALESYYFFRDDARFGGWQSYLQRSDDFIRFCCHKHIAEMLTARGGAGPTRVVWRWPSNR